MLPGRGEVAEYQTGHSLVPSALRAIRMGVGQWPMESNPAASIAPKRPKNTAPARLRYDEDDIAAIFSAYVSGLQPRDAERDCTATGRAPPNSLQGRVLLAATTRALDGISAWRMRRAAANRSPMHGRHLLSRCRREERCVAHGIRPWYPARRGGAQPTTPKNDIFACPRA